MSDIKYIDIKEFRELGFLQELNRQFLHPLGLALEINIDDNTGEETLGGIWDYREDSEGMLFGEGSLSRDKANMVEGERKRHLESRWREGCDGEGIQLIV
tara:strand:- start:116 stop:415 length:300 start_codon:yes stop_codon:yes gene_type:complete